MTQRYSTPPPSPLVHALSLTPHPEALDTAVRSIDARVCRRQRGTLTVAYVLEGQLDRLRVPAPRAARFANRLWEHTCFEIFIRAQGLPAYHEFNLSPSGEWAAYAFERYREGVPLVDESLNPQVTVRSAAGKLEVEAVIRLDLLSPTYARTALALAVSAVVEHRDGAICYWALRHPAGKPDFHHPDAFALRLDEIRN
jgi:hypothetical protein